MSQLQAHNPHSTTLKRRNTEPPPEVRRSKRLKSSAQQVPNTSQTLERARGRTVWFPPSPQSASRKRKRVQETERSCSPLVSKYQRIEVKNSTVDGRPIVEQAALVDHWIQHGSEWSDLLRETVTMDHNGPQKRMLARSNSWKASTDSGNTPKAWGGKHAAVMLDKGIFMERQDGVTIARDDEPLCKDILDARYALPSDWQFQEGNLSRVLRLSLYKNERRVTRDLWPHIMPSPELHHARGHPGVEHIAEGVDAQWTKCTSLCGPKSRPDMCQGISRFIFNNEEREKLTSNNTCASETMVFPFYICEAKCFDKSIEESELQALHGASVACNAIIELYQQISAADELHRRILAFSVSHDQRRVKIFGHFAMIDGGSTTFHRHQLFETDLVDDTASHSRPYEIALGIWEHFYPIHLARIRHALALQTSRAMESFTAQLGLDEESQVFTPSSSQEDTQSKRASTARARRMQLDNEDLKTQLSALIEEMRVQREGSQKQLAQQKEESQKQLAQQKEESQKQLAQQKEESQKQLAQQKEDSRRQLELLERLIARLPQSEI